MENQSKNLVKHIFVTGSIVAGSLLGVGAVKTINAETLFNYGSLGSGAELRTSLLSTSPERNLEMKCGSKTDTKAEKKSGADDKLKDGKCGDKKMDSKAKDGKCGEGKCGDGKMEGKSMEKKELKESKPVEKQAAPKK